MKKFLGLLCVLLVAEACSSAGRPSTGTMANGCTEISDPGGPVVCVDDSVDPPKLSAFGKKIHVHSQQGANGGFVYVTWKSMQGGALDMIVDPSSTGQKCHAPQAHKTCSGDTCTIKVNPRAKQKTCDYNIWVKGGNKADPVIIVDEWPLVPPVKKEGSSVN